ncbi:MAG: hypothetical protein GY809_04450, partial [Planctomycetes bacterium]|nr:hypothetical protein [Planctomycetota bacterium]
MTKLMCVGLMLCLCVLATAVEHPGTQTAMDRYVHAPDPAYGYALRKTETSDDGTT